MAKPLAHDLDVNAVGKEQACVGVAEPVEAYARGEGGTSDQAIPQGAEPLAHGDGVHRPAVEPREDQVASVVARPERQLLLADALALLTEGVDALLAGDMDIGKAILRDYINATVGFDKLAQETGTPAKSLMRMFGPRGNPNARNLFSVMHRLQSASGISLRVRTSR